VVDGYEICKASTCLEPVKRDGQIWCVSQPACTNRAGCGCHLFRADGNETDPEWKHYGDPYPQKKDHEEPNRYYYRCFCAKKKP
jgi:hypothetical protein